MNLKERSKHLLVIVVGMLLLHFILVAKGYLETNYLLYVATSLGFLGLVSDTLCILIVKGWFLIGKALGYVNSKILLGTIYFIILLPMALLSRFLKGDVLNLEPPNSESLYLEKKHLYRKEDLENPW